MTDDAELGVVEKRMMNYRAMYKDRRDLVKMAWELDRVRGLLDDASAKKSELEAQHDVLRLEILPNLMEEQGLENFKVDKLGRVGLTADMHVAIKPGLKDKFYKWLRAKRLGDLVQETVNSSTLKAFIKDRVRGNKPYPKELLNVTAYTRASITKG